MATDNAQRVGGLSQKDARQQRQNWPISLTELDWRSMQIWGWGVTPPHTGRLRLWVYQFWYSQAFSFFSLMASCELDCFLKLVVSAELSAMKFFLWRFLMKSA
jgi:hypothetical protein